MANQGTSRMPKKASDHIPYCKDQGIEYLCGTTAPGFGVQSKRITMPPGGIFDFEDEGLSVMEDADYMVFAENKAVCTPFVNSIAGPYGLVDGQTLTVSVDQGPVDTLTFEGAAAVIVSGNPQNYNLGAGDSDLEMAIDGGAPQTAVIAAARAMEESEVQPFAVADGQTVTISVDGGAIRTATFLGDAAVLTSAAEAYDLSADALLNVYVDGGGLQAIDFDAAFRATCVNPAVATAVEVAAWLNTEIAGVSAAATMGNEVELTSDTEGTGSSIHVTGGTANAELGFPTVIATGAGNVQNLATVTAAEAAALINTAITGDGGQAVVAGGRVQVYGAIYGTGGQLDFGGTARATLDLDVGPINGTGDVVNAAAASAAEVVAVINRDIAGVTADSPTNDVRITTDLAGLDASIEILGGTANAVLDFALVPEIGTGNVGDIANVLDTEVASLLEITFPGTYTEIMGTGGVIFGSTTMGRAGWIQVTGGTANPVIQFPIAPDQGDGNVPAISLKSAAGFRISGPLPDDEVVVCVIGRVHGMTA